MRVMLLAYVGERSGGLIALANHPVLLNIRSWPARR